MKKEILLATMLANSPHNQKNEVKIFKKKNVVIRKMVLFYENNLLKIIGVSLTIMIAKEIYIMNYNFIHNFLK